MPRAKPKPPAQWAASVIEQRPVLSLLAYAANARTHSDAQVAQIAASIREFGFVNPVLVDEGGEIIAGHGRVMAAKLLGMATVPTIERGGLSDAQRRALRLADNKLAMNSGWDEALLAAELTALSGMEFDLDLIGFDTSELDALIRGEPAASPAAAAAPALADDEPDPADQDVEPPRQRVTRSGDMWLLGPHRLLCDDSTSGDAVAKLMAGEHAALLFTSPPYGQQRNYTTGGIGDWETLMRGVFQHAGDALAEDGQVLVNLGMTHKDSEWHPYWQGWIEWMRTTGWRRFGWYVWDQGAGMPGDWNGRMGPCFEFIFHFNKESRRPNKITPNKLAGGVRGGGDGLRDVDGKIGSWTGDGSVAEMRIPDALVRVARASTGTIAGGQGHPAVFPVKLPAFLMETYANAGDLVLEPFSGSGTTILAGQRTGRRVRAIELAPDYVDLAVARWQILHPNIPVTLDGDGRSFVAIAEERANG